jgi:hypothetical protein
MRLGPSSVLRGRKFDVLAQNKAVLPAVARDAAVPAERLLPDSAAVLPDDVSAALGRTAGLCRCRLRRPGLHRSDGAASSLCGCACGSLSLERDAGRSGVNLTESLAVR